MKKGVFLTCFSMLATAFISMGFVACAENSVPEKGCGNFGEYVEYVLNDDGASYTVQMFSGEKIRGYASETEFLNANEHITAITGELVIPSTYNDKPVTAVGAYAFAFCSFDSVILPDSVTDIGFNAFKDCDDLMSITLGAGLNNVGFGAFANCYKLVEIYNKSNLEIAVGNKNYGEVATYAKDVYTQPFDSKIKKDKNGYVTYDMEDGLSLINYMGGRFNVDLPEGITEINRYAFADYDELISIRLPSSLKRIEADAFKACNGLKEVYVSDFTSWSQIVYEDYSAQPFNYASELYVGDELITNLQLPQSVTEISDYAFYSIESITSVTIPSTLIELSENAFAWCKNLESVNLSQSLQSIGGNAFTGCTALKEISLPNSLKMIGNYAFSLSGLVEISVPDSVESLGEGVFCDCKELEGVTLGEKVTAIKKETFYNCDKLSRINMGNSVRSIANFAFANCVGLEEISFSTQLAEIGESAFFSCENLKQLRFSDALAYLGTGAFEYCKNLQSVLLGGMVETIANYAFYGCESLTEVYYKGDADAFSDVVVGGGNEPFNNATLYYYSENPPQEDGNFWHFEEGQIKKYE